jgi:hypothetical protein
MDAGDFPARIGLPNWARAAGWFLFAGELLFVGRIVFESTILTCNNGPQMVGFSVLHQTPGLFLVGLVCFFSGFALAVGSDYLAFNEKV